MKMKRSEFLRLQLNSSTANVVPTKFYPYLYDMNNAYALVDSSVILGRKKELNKLFNCFLRAKKANVVLLGEHGIGKTAIVQKLVDCIIHRKCPKGLLDHHLIYLDVGKLLANIDNKRFNKMLKEIYNFIAKYNNLIVVIDQIHLTQLDYKIVDFLDTLLTISHVKILGVSTYEDFYDCFEFNTKSRSRFEVITVKEPEPNEIYPMIYKVIENKKAIYGVDISENIVKYIISISGAFYSELCNPALTVDIVEKSMVMTKRKKKKAVTKEIVNLNFDFDYKLYNKMSDEDKEIVAYHEAGHFIVQKMSDNIRNYKSTAISIIPSEDFLGITLFEFEPGKQTSLDENYYIDNIAVDLAGRIAESIYFNSEDRYTSGAHSDLNYATETARRIVTEYGMIEDCGKNMSYLGNLDIITISLLSEDIKNKIDAATHQLISKAETRAKEILNANKDLLERLANELLANEVLDEADLDRICEEVKNSK